ncbi:hypothetical protein PanWU01x14_367920 [Parasponia andersonii]|uniref:Uncharacterized protein n=1 Tax=Parasponia andersonii TaxID=3476 RepID=A0A2P5A579_PARAD|nr:hypothetical protein PanWU01x14_367920 [Parasponia andersonii]
MSQTDGDPIFKAIESIVQKTSALKCSDSTMPHAPNIAGATNACRRSVAVKILGEETLKRKAISDLVLLPLWSQWAQN